MDILQLVVRAAIVLALIIAVLSLFGISPYDAGQAVGDFLDTVGETLRNPPDTSVPK